MAVSNSASATPLQCKSVGEHLVPSETAAAGRFALPGFHLFTHRLFEHWSTAQNNGEKKKKKKAMIHAIKQSDVPTSSHLPHALQLSTAAWHRSAIEVQVDKDQTRSNDSSLLSPYSSEGYVLHPN